jgi:hypothetical protein
MPYFNAIIAVTSRGIMEAKNTKTGEFLPLKPITGVDALLIIRKLKKELKLNRLRISKIIHDAELFAASSFNKKSQRGRKPFLFVGE